VDAGRLHPDQDLPVPGHRAFHLLDPQHLDPAELVVPDCLWHDLCFPFGWNSPGSTQAGSLLGLDLEAGSHHTRPWPPDLVPGETTSTALCPRSSPPTWSRPAGPPPRRPRQPPHV